MLAIPAFLLASFVQLAVTLAMILALIPIGPWRKAVVAAVRVLTLTLGDSYVLLDQEIQHAALVARVRRSLAWLTERTERIVVIAHSQGGAIAHEALGNDSPPKVASFISVGSGLEKLQFLRTVIGDRSGLVCASLLFPIALANLCLTIFAVSTGGPTWLKTLPSVGLVALAGLIGVLYASLQSYRKQAEKGADALHPPHALKEWLDLYAAFDLVPMGSGSLLRDKPFLTLEKLCNEYSILRDHVSYFTNHDCLHRLCAAIGRVSALPLFGPGDSFRLDRLGRIHSHHALVLLCSRIGCVIAAFILVFVLRNELVGFGASVMATVKDTPAEEWLKPVRAFAGFFASIIERVWGPGISAAPAFTPILALVPLAILPTLTLAPSTPLTSTLTHALFGLFFLLGTLFLWWTAFRGIWKWRCTARWHRAARGADYPSRRIDSITGGISLLIFALTGALPLITAVGIWLWPGAFTLVNLLALVSGSVSILFLLIAFFYAGAGPWLDFELRRTPDSPLANRLILAAASALCGPLFLFLTRLLWPATLLPAVLDILTGVIILLTALAWQIYVILIHPGFEPEPRGSSVGWQIFALFLQLSRGRIWTWLIVTLPLALTLAISRHGFMEATLIYAGSTALLICATFLWYHRHELRQVPGDIVIFFTK